MTSYFSSLVFFSLSSSCVSSSHRAFVSQVTISTALKTLAEGAARRAEGASSELDHAGGESIENGPLQDFRVISEVSVKLLPALFKRIEHLAAPVSNGGDVTPSENVQAVQSVTVAIGELARLCPKPFLQSLFKKVMHKLVSATQQHQQGEGTNEDDNEHESQICTLLRLAHALVTSASLDRDSINLLYRVTKPFIRSDEMAPKIQKQAYKVMAEICQRHCDFVSSADHRVETIELLVGSIMTCHVSSRHMRLKCLVHLVDGLDSSNEDHMVRLE